MFFVRPENINHKIQLFKLLTEILDNQILAANLFFKGGTCASMLGFLDRFSVDLDFDLKKSVDEKLLRTEFHRVFKNCDLKIDSESKKFLNFIVKYKAQERERNSIEVDALNFFVAANKYEPKFFEEINRYAVCQTAETMFSNKLVAPLDRFKKHRKVAGRDLFDIHSFFMKSFKYNKDVIMERTGLTCLRFFKKLIDFIDVNFDEKIITEDLNSLLPYDVFKKIRKNLKTETLWLLKNEAARFKVDFF